MPDSKPATTYTPSAEFAAAARGQQDLVDAAGADRLQFWADQAREFVTWNQPFTETLDWSGAPFAKWFVGGRLNAAYNCVDRHVEAGLGDRVALHFVGEPGDTEDVTYRQLQDRVCQAANALTGLGVGAGDPVAIYMPMIPEAVVAMLACARIGAPHSVVFGGFSADSLSARIDDVQARVVITADGGFRRGAPLGLKETVDEAVSHVSCVEKVLVVQRTSQDVSWHDGRDVWWHECVDSASAQHVPEFFDSEHPLFVLYTSGTTGRPKGIVHTTGGYLTQAAFTNAVIHDVHPESDVYWCTADVGWITGHSYIVYGPLANAATQVIYEGTPDTPHRGRWWEIIEQYKVTILYTAPTAVRTFMKWGTDELQKFDLTSLRLLGSVGEPINPEAWLWYRKHVGANKCPIVDTWWQTETGAIMISPMPGLTSLEPGSAQQPVPGVSVDIVDDHGDPVEGEGSGYLVLTEPWPSMLRGVWGDEQRYRDTYWSRFPGKYFAGDGAKRDSNGNIWLLGRVDDVMMVSGHRLSTAEIESALVHHDAVAEAAVVGAHDETTGQSVRAFVILRQGVELADANRELRQHVAHVVGSVARPHSVTVVPDLPKTRSGKIMRRLLRDLAEGRTIGDSTTLADRTVVDKIAESLAADNN